MTDEMSHFLINCVALATKKNHDYHPENVAFLEILRTCFDTKIRVEQDLWGRFSKQMSALRRYVIDGHVESEPPVQRMMDVANYMAILSVWHAYKVSILNGAIEHVRGLVACELSELPSENKQFLTWLCAYKSEMLSRP